jgi:hypothetical protein
MADTSKGYDLIAEDLEIDSDLFGGFGLWTPDDIYRDFRRDPTFWRNYSEIYLAGYGKERKTAGLVFRKVNGLWIRCDPPGRLVVNIAKEEQLWGSTP